LEIYKNVNLKLTYVILKGNKSYTVLIHWKFCDESSQDPV